VGGTVEDTDRSLFLQKQGLYATIMALGSLRRVGLPSPMAVALYPFPGAPGAGFISYQPTNFFAVEPNPSSPDKNIFGNFQKKYN